MTDSLSKIKTEITYPIEYYPSGAIMVRHKGWGCHIQQIIDETEWHLMYERFINEHPYDPYGQTRYGHDQVMCYIKPFVQQC